MPWPQLPAPCLCLLPLQREPEPSRNTGPRKRTQGAPSALDGPRWCQTLLLPQESHKRGSGCFSWSHQFSEQGSLNRTSFPKEGVGNKCWGGVSSSQGGRRTASPLSSCSTASPAPQPAPSPGWLGPGASPDPAAGGGVGEQRPPACERSLEAAGLSPGLGRHPPTLPPSDPTPSVQLLFIRKRVY